VTGGRQSPRTSNDSCSASELALASIGNEHSRPGRSRDAATAGTTRRRKRSAEGTGVSLTWESGSLGYLFLVATVSSAAITRRRKRRTRCRVAAVSLEAEAGPI
jgi:hypothetical protein